MRTPRGRLRAAAAEGDARQVGAGVRAARALSASAVAAAVVLVAPPAAAQDCVVAAAGDVAGAEDYSRNAERTGNQIAASPAVAVIALGDLAYDDGTAAEFAAYYDPTWGVVKDRTLPIPGNHERSGAGYRSYFGDAAWQNRVVTVCGWRVLLVNQYLGVERAAAFLRDNDSAAPEVVAWHAPRWSSGRGGSTASVQPLWQAAVDIRARIVLSGHDHHYERFKPMNASGRGSYHRPRQFVSGLGGHNPHRLGTTRPNSQVRYTGQPGVLFLDLRADRSYGWTFTTVDGVVRDRGSQPVPR